MSCLKIWWLKTSVIYCWTFLGVLVMSRFIGFYHVLYEIFKTLDPKHNMLCVPNIIISFGLYVLLDASQTQWAPSCSKRLWFKTTIQRDHPSMVSKNNVFILFYFILFFKGLIFLKFWKYVSSNFCHVPYKFVVCFLQVFPMFL